MNEQMEYAMNLWNLHDFRTVYEREQSAVWYCQSADFGPVVLKWNRTGQLDSEYRMLSRLQGRGCCKVYGYDIDRGLLLEERILPGTVLREEASPEKRVAVLASVFREIHLPQDDGETYLAWLDRACTFCTAGDVPGDLARLAQKAREICAYLFEKYPERVLLHGDLHHDNLIHKSDGSYAVIDPKGVVGPEILDLPRFLLNEGDFGGSDHMDKVISLVCQACGYPEEDLRQALFMEAVLANMWCVEDGVPPRERWLELSLSEA
jgi:streptomycin 6-kinase